MKTVALACETISEEIKLVADDLNTGLPIHWIESGLHNTPERLKQYIQAEIERTTDADYILMLFGYCGNSLLGLKSEKSRLVIPRVDDCISLLLGGNKRRNAINSKAMAYYLTRGWLQHENNLWNEYNYCLEKYGPHRTRQIYRVMLKNYKSLNVIKTGAFDLAELLPQTKQIAAELNLSHEIIEGSLSIIYKAFRKEWDADFAVIEPGQPVSLENLGIMASGSEPEGRPA